VALVDVRSHPAFEVGPVVRAVCSRADARGAGATYPSAPRMRPTSACTSRRTRSIEPQYAETHPLELAIAALIGREPSAPFTLNLSGFWGRNFSSSAEGSSRPEYGERPNVTFPDGGNRKRGGSAVPSLSRSLALSPRRIFGEQDEERASAEQLVGEPLRLVIPSSWGRLRRAHGSLDRSSGGAFLKEHTICAHGSRFYL
jgi:hypothetical protein